MVPAGARRGALQLPRLLPGRRAIRSARSCSRSTTRCIPGDAKFTGGSACSGLYRGLRLWAAAVTEAGSLEQADVIAALDHARDRRRPGRAGGDGARPASPAPEHVHRPGARRPVRDRREPRRDRPAGAPRRAPPAAAPPDAASRHTTNRRDAHAARNDPGRGLRPLHGGLLDRRRREAQAARVQGGDRSSATRPRTTASGCIFDWDEQGWQSFVSDPEVPPIMKEAGHKSKPQAAAFAGRCDA